METAETKQTNPDVKVLNVRERLELLRQWLLEWIETDKLFENELLKLGDSKQDIQRGVQLIHLRKAALYRLIKEPIYLEYEGIMSFGIKEYRQKLVVQYATLTKDEKILWLNNLLFILTPNLQELDDKVNDLLGLILLGQGRNLLISGLSGTGKSTYLFWKAASKPPEVKESYNEVPIVIIQCPVNNKSSKYLFRRIITSLGKTYLGQDNDEDLFDKACVFLATCKVKLLILDEIEHLRELELRRRILELSNTVNIHIIGSAVSPEKFVEGDIEIAGRFNDILSIDLYKGDELLALLGIIDLLLPFPLSSNLHISEIMVEGQTIDGPSKFIESVTKGVLRDIMRLIFDASLVALKRNAESLSLEELQVAWKKIQHEPIKTLHEKIQQMNQGNV